MTQKEAVLIVEKARESVKKSEAEDLYDYRRKIFSAIFSVHRYVKYHYDGSEIYGCLQDDGKTIATVSAKNASNFQIGVSAVNDVFFVNCMGITAEDYKNVLLQYVKRLYRTYS